MFLAYKYITLLPPTAVLKKRKQTLKNSFLEVEGTKNRKMGIEEGIIFTNFQMSA